MISILNKLRKYKLLLIVLTFCIILISVLVLSLVKGISIEKNKPAVSIDKYEVSEEIEVNQYRKRDYYQYELEFPHDYFNDTIGYFHSQYRLNFKAVQQKFYNRWISSYPDHEHYNLTFLSFQFLDQYGLFCDQVLIYFYTIDYYLLQNWKVYLLK